MLVNLVRLQESEQGTRGILYIRGGEHRPVYTLELPWVDNQANVSRIPAGSYRCVPHGWAGNRRFKDTWRLLDVPQRTAILLHAGNSIEDTEGCILVGLGSMEDRLLSSKDAMEYLRKEIGQQEFTLVIGDYFDE